VSRIQQKVLLVEDDDAVSLMIKMVLEQSGYQVFVATTAQRALQLFEREHAQMDVVLTDIVLPGGMSGAQLAETLRARQPELKVIFTTGYSTEQVARDLTLELGTNFIQKPYEAASLLQIVRRALKGE
jgi:DNA-binding NtrC family response regulator